MNIKPEELDYLTNKLMVQGLSPEEIDQRIKDLIRKEGKKRKRERRPKRK